MKDSSDFIMDIINIKRSKKTDEQKHADLMQLIIQYPENLHYTALILKVCILDDGSFVSRTIN